MPVDFHCPHCLAKMRTPDEAMGRETGCPKCAGRLTIPTVDIIEPDPVAVLVDDPKAGVVTEPVPSGPSPSAPVAAPPEPPSHVPAMPVAATDAFAFDAAPSSSPPVGSGQPSGASRPYRRKKKSGIGVMVMIGLVSVAILGGVAFVVNSGPGDMTGTAVAKIVPGEGLSTSIPLPAGPSSERLVRELGSDPVQLRTELFETSFGATGTELLVRVTKTSVGEIFEVDFSADPAVSSWLEANGQASNQRRLTRLAENVATMAVAIGTDPPSRDGAAAYRDSVGLAGLQNGLGPHLIAEAAGFAHPVVSEPSPGVLRWVLPQGTIQFAVLPAPANRGGLPATFRYDVTVSR